jgi:hypothetical protein
MYCGKECSGKVCWGCADKYGVCREHGCGKVDDGDGRPYCPICLGEMMDSMNQSRRESERSSSTDKGCGGCGCLTGGIIGMAIAGNMLQNNPMNANEGIMFGMPIIIGIIGLLIGIVVGRLFG